MNDGRRINRWYLVDQHGSAHLAVIGVERDTKDGHYNYTAVSARALTQMCQGASAYMRTLFCADVQHDRTAVPAQQVDHLLLIVLLLLLIALCRKSHLRAAFLWPAAISQVSSSGWKSGSRTTLAREQGQQLAMVRHQARSAQVRVVTVAVCGAGCVVGFSPCA